MSKRKKRESSLVIPSGASIPEASTAQAEEKSQALLRPPDVFRIIFEKSLELARSASQGSVLLRPMVLFLFAQGTAAEQLKESTLKAVSVVWKNDFHKEALRMRIHDKAEQEGATAIVFLMPEQDSGSREGTLLLAGAMAGITVNAFVTHRLEGQTGTLSFSEMTWLDRSEAAYLVEKG